jgi:hypothetical protein
VIGVEALGLVALVLAIRWPTIRKHFDTADVQDIEHEVLRHHAIQPYASHALSGEHHTVLPMPAKQAG